MSLVKSSLYKAIVLLLAFTLAVQKTAAQAVLCGQYQNFTSTSGLYESKSKVEDEQDGTAFSTTWDWTANGSYASQTHVHSYANVKSRSNILPVMLSKITVLTVSANWAMYPSGPEDPNIFDIDGLSAIGAKADVTLDFFLDPDITQSTNVTNPKFEVMIWFAALNATEPIGYASGSAGSTLLDGKNYTLFSGHNNQLVGEGNQPGQEVFSFVAPENMTSFTHLDILPLFQYLLDGHKMAGSTYLGTAQFGTEAFHADGKNVTFEASGIDLNIQTTPVAPTKTNAPPAKTNTAPKKSSAVSLKGVGGFNWCWGLLEGAIGAWMLWSWML